MLIKRHSQATTTPKIRAVIQASEEPAWVAAERQGTSGQTVWKWRKRDSVKDRSHTPHRLQTTLTPAQEAVAEALRKTLLVSLDDVTSRQVVWLFLEQLRLEFVPVICCRFRGHEDKIVTKESEIENDETEVLERVQV